jgi:Rap1a immunity proteins
MRSDSRARPELTLRAVMRSSPGGIHLSAFQSASLPLFVFRGFEMLRRSLLGFLLLSGCAHSPPVTYTKPGASNDELQITLAKCRLALAQSPLPCQQPTGASAAVARIIDNGQSQRSFINDCMTSNGWFPEPVPQLSGPPVLSAAPQQLATPTFAATTGAFTTGQALFDACKSSDKTMQALCIAYIGGVSDGIVLSLSPEEKANLWCVPQSAALIDLQPPVLTFLQTHSQWLDGAASASVAAAVMQTYPCKQTQ